jgi:hypothetical protein
VVRRIDLMRPWSRGVTAVLGTSTGFLPAVLVAARDVDPLGHRSRPLPRGGRVGARRHALRLHPRERRRSRPVGRPDVERGGRRRAFRARDFQFLPQSSLDDGCSDVSTIEALDPAATAALVPLVPERRSTCPCRRCAAPAVGAWRGSRTDGSRSVAFDGDVWDAAGPRLTAHVLAGALSVLAPTTPPCG